MVGNPLTKKDNPQYQLTGLLPQAAFPRPMAAGQFLPQIRNR